MSRPVNILVVDDEPLICSSLVALLGTDERTIVTALSSDEVLELVKTFCPDIAIIDWMLRSRLDGMELAQQIRLRYPHVGVIIASGFLSDALLEKIAGQERISFLAKPSAPEILMNLIDELLKT